ncbi:MAG: hypothetical protein H7338_10025, partial [Candidatus Sericytochromatia bacterium]|nr:hypothetical protein [Candidatus Sericytochromatia bacterium]
MTLPEEAHDLSDGPELLVAADAMQDLLIWLQSRCGIDFSAYKTKSVERRLTRRMVVHGVQTIDQYRRILAAHPEEVEALYAELLIHVTGFFRDPEVFEFLQQSVLPRIIGDRADGQAIRIWVPGCASGEEVYSLAICLLECLGDDMQRIPIQLFASDIGAAALAEGRAGC